jgi:cytochrome c5
MSILRTAVEALRASCFVVLAAACGDQAIAQKATTVQLNQGWSKDETQFYHHATEGANLAPLDFFLNLPDPAKPGSRFIAKLTKEYGFIPSEESSANPHGLPVGLAVDDRPAKYKDRVYVGITCAACHTRQLTYSRREPKGKKTSWVLPVHGGPAMLDFPRFKRDLYDAFLRVLEDDRLARQFAKDLLGRTPTSEDIAGLRNEIRQFTQPVLVTRALIQEANVPEADFGPGNLNALSQGNYNNFALTDWLSKRQGAVPEDRPRPRFEGAANFPPMWFAHQDDWGQYFVEIHHPGVRNWVQAVSTSEVRPLRMVEALGPAVVLGTIHFDNIAEIQRLLEGLRTPKWPESVLGALDRSRVEQGRALYREHCQGCHAQKRLPPNNLGIVFHRRAAYDVGTDPTAYQQFMAHGAARVEGLTELSKKIIGFRRTQLQGADQETVENYLNLYSRGRPNAFGIAKDYQGDVGAAKWPKSGATYWAPPLEGIFASSPYFHNGSVRTLWDVLTPPAERPKSFRTGSTEFDAEGVGLRDDGLFVYETKQPGKSNAGHLFGTDLSRDQRTALIEYLKSL